MADPDVLLFSYGTLQQPEVQLATFGRRLDGQRDAVAGHELSWVTIRGPHVVATSGSDRHPVLVPSDRPGAAVDGTVFAVTAAELAAADAYEVDDYVRVLVPLRSGRRAWVYALAAPAVRDADRDGTLPSGSRTFVVGPADTAAAVGSGDLDVLSTPTLLAWMEATTLTAGGPLDPSLTSLGTSAAIEHVAACRVGAEVTVDARITERDGRRTTFAVTAHDSRNRLLGSASITRVTVDVERFLGRVPE